MENDSPSTPVEIQSLQNRVIALPQALMVESVCIADIHGKITVRSLPGQGDPFLIVLPRGQPARADD